MTGGRRVLVVEDDAAFACVLTTALGAALGGTPVEVVSSAGEALARVAADGVAALVVDRRLPDGDGVELLLQLRARGAEVPAIMVTSDGSAESAVAAMRAGVSDYLVKGRTTVEGVVAAVGVLAREAGRTSTGGRGVCALVGGGAAVGRLRGEIRNAARSAACVLVEGETGVGKELVARALHEESARARGPFVAVNCGALPEQLVESELFGHLRGAFTGAHRDHPGLVEAASGGTLFLDEVEDLPASLQGKLLRLLQEGEFRPVGATRPRLADVRVVAASNADLARLVAERRFRRDLFFRLNVLHISVPPLRERPEDVPPLVAHFLARRARATRRGAKGEPGPRREPTGCMPTPEQLAAMARYRWPGNVRELESLVERAAVFAAAASWHTGWEAAVGGLGGMFAFPDAPAGGSRDAPPPGSAGAVDAGTHDAPIAPSRDEDCRLGEEAEALRRVLDRHRWRREAAARALGISRVTLWRRMRRSGLGAAQGGEPGS